MIIIDVAVGFPRRIHDPPSVVQDGTRKRERFIRYPADETDSVGQNGGVAWKCLSFLQSDIQSK